MSVVNGFLGCQGQSMTWALFLVVVRRFNGWSLDKHTAADGPMLDGVIGSIPNR